MMEIRSMKSWDIAQQKKIRDGNKEAMKMEDDRNSVFEKSRKEIVK